MNMLFTIGHSNHVAGQLISLLRLHGVKAIADVRSNPYSQRFPQFNRGVFEGLLKASGIQYVFLGRELGARREERECYTEGRANYSLIAKTANFQEGLRRIHMGLSKMPIALLCAEHDPLTCHRTILVCRHLRAQCSAIHHILRDGSLESNCQAELRLVRELGCGDSLVTPSIIEQAYDLRGRNIAYTEESAETGKKDEYPELDLK